MKIVEAVCILLGLFFDKSALAVDLTLYTNETGLKEHYPRLIYDGSVVNLCKGELNFEFKTFLKTALVLYQDDGGADWTFFAIDLRDGRLHVEADLGHMIDLENVTSKTYNDFKWHSVGIRLKCPEPCVEITVDDKVVYRKGMTNIMSCKFTENLQIGGFSKERLDDINSVTWADSLR